MKAEIFACISIRASKPWTYPTLLNFESRGTFENTTSDLNSDPSSTTDFAAPKPADHMLIAKLTQ